MKAATKKSATKINKSVKMARGRRAKSAGTADEPRVRIVESALQVAQRTMCLVLTFSGIGNRRKVSNSQVEVDADKDWIAVSKRLIDADEFDAIRSLDGEIRRYIKNTALPGMLKEGMHLLPVELVEPVTAKLREYDIQRRMLVKRFVAVYAKLINEASVRLGALFNQTDYMHPDDVEQTFRLRWQLIQFTTPASLEQINRDLYEQEKAKAEAQWTETCGAIEQMLFADFAEFVSHLETVLSPDAHGAKKVFRDTAITKFQSFLELIDARNATGHVQLKALADQAKALISDVKPNRLRNSQDLRKQVRDGFSKIRQALSPLIVTQPSRAISFEEV